MKIKTLMDFLNREEIDSRVAQAGGHDADFNTPHREKVVYIENARLETAGEQAASKELIKNGTQWADQSMGDILVSHGKLKPGDINRIVDHQRKKGLYFGEAGVELGLVTQDDILKALSAQFGYSYGHDDSASQDMVMASAPFGDAAEEFRSIRAHLLAEWLAPNQKTLAIVGPGTSEGRSYFAANIALAFSQLGRSTLLIDADLRAPRQQEIFGMVSRVGLSTLLAGRMKSEELDMLPDRLSAFPYLSVLGSGPVPPNPSELLANERFSSILRKLEKYFDVIIIDSPTAAYSADVLSIAAVAGSALLVARRGYSRIDESKSLLKTLNKAKARVVGAVMNTF